MEKEFIYFLATFPAIIFICAGYHYDYLYFGISLILLGLLINYLKEERSVGRKQLAIFMAFSASLAFVKFPYVLLGFLVVLLPKKQYKEKKIAGGDVLFSWLK